MTSYTVYLVRKYAGTGARWTCHHTIVPQPGGHVPSGGTPVATFGTWDEAGAWCAAQAIASGRELWSEWTC